MPVICCRMPTEMPIVMTSRRDGCSRVFGETRPRSRSASMASLISCRLAAARSLPPTRSSTASASVSRPCNGKPARAFRHEQQCDEVKHGGQRLDAEHPPPAPLPEPERLGPCRTRLAQRQYQVIAEKRERDSDDDVQLVERHEPAPGLGRRHLGDVHRRDDQRGTHAEAAQHAGDNQPEKIGRQRR